LFPTDIQGELPWVTSCGIVGATAIKATLADAAAAQPPASYTVRLYFAEPEQGAKAGDRVFSVKLQGQTVLGDFDIVREAAGPRRTVVKEFKRVQVGDALSLELTAKTGRPLVCGMEAVAE
jgi:hypothetical protein